jgi:hypothetical protein
MYCVEALRSSHRQPHSESARFQGSALAAPGQEFLITHFMSDSVNGRDNFMLDASLFNHVLQNLKLSPPWWGIDNGGVAQQW